MKPSAIVLVGFTLSAIFEIAACSTLSQPEVSSAPEVTSESASSTNQNWMPNKYNASTGQYDWTPDFGTTSPLVAGSQDAAPSSAPRPPEAISTNSEQQHSASSNATGSAQLSIGTPAQSSNVFPSGSPFTSDPDNATNLAVIAQSLINYAATKYDVDNEPPLGTFQYGASICMRNQLASLPADWGGQTFAQFVLPSGQVVYSEYLLGDPDETTEITRDPADDKNCVPLARQYFARDDAPTGLVAAEARPPRPISTAPASTPPPNFSGNDPFWIKATNVDCWAFIPLPGAPNTVKWNGECRGRLLSGDGMLSWYSPPGKLRETDKGSFSGGVMQGTGTLSFYGDDVTPDMWDNPITITTTFTNGHLGDSRRVTIFDQQSGTAKTYAYVDRGDQENNGSGGIPMAAEQDIENNNLAAKLANGHP